MSSFQQYPTSSSNKRKRPDASSQHSTEESFKRLRVTSSKRERPQEEGAHSSEDALQSFKRLRVNDNSTLSNEPQQEEHETLYPQSYSPQQHTSSQQAGQATSSNEVPNNYAAMNRLLGKLHQERRLQHHRHAESHLPFDSKLY